MELVLGFAPVPGDVVGGLRGGQARRVEGQCVSQVRGCRQVPRGQKRLKVSAEVIFLKRARSGLARRRSFSASSHTR